MAFENSSSVGAYTITGKIGSGGMATVYRAHQERLGRDVAIKVMHLNIAQDADFLARFEREARIVARLDHRSIVPIYDYDDYEGQPYLVMKFVDGMTLKNELQNGLPSTERALVILAQVGDALTYAHEQGILHRDIKPSNILIDDRGTPFITDFGLARIAQSGESTMSADVMLGTPHYISPEQARGNNDLDARSDVYSLGIVAYEMLTGRTPFLGDTSYAIIHDQIYTPPPPARDINPDLPIAVEAVLAKALDKNRDHRYATPRDLVTDLARALQGQTVDALPAQAAKTDNDVPVPSRKSASNRVHNTPPPVPRPPQPPKAPNDLGLGGIGDSLRDIGDSIREAVNEGLSEVRQEIDTNRLMWRPGTNWTTGPDGRQGFYTEDELEVAESKLTDEQRLEKRVRKRIKERDGLITHAVIYLLVNAMLWGIWLFTGADFPWPMFVTGGWGIGIFTHWAEYHNKYGAGRTKREQMIEREVQRERERLMQSQAYSKPKNDPRHMPEADVRLTEDGELSESFVDQYLDDDQQRQSR